MNTTENQLAIIEKPSDRKWPYVLGGFVAGVASIIGAAYLIDNEGDERNDSSHSDEEIEEDSSENDPIEDIAESTQCLTENR